VNILFISHILGHPSIDGGSQIIANTQKELAVNKHKTFVISSNCTSTDDFINPKSQTVKTNNTKYSKTTCYQKQKFLLYYLNEHQLLLQNYQMF